MISIKSKIDNNFGKRRKYILPHEIPNYRSYKFDLLKTSRVKQKYLNRAKVLRLNMKYYNLLVSNNVNDDNIHEIYIACLQNLPIEILYRMAHSNLKGMELRKLKWDLKKDYDKN